MRYVALLRGINVGGHRKIAMRELRGLLAGLGYSDVVTHLQSGNAVFTATGSAATVERAIEAAIERELGHQVSVMVRTGKELAAVVEGDPLGDVATDPKRYVVVFLSAAPDPERVGAADLARFEPELIRIAGREVYVWSPMGLADTKVPGTLWEKKLGVTGTARNWNTVTRLLELVTA